MRWPIVTVALFGLGAALADEPPSYMPFEVRSPDARYVAKIARNPGGTPSDPRYGWIVTVYESPSDPKVQPTRVLWSCPFRYSGYPGALLSRDGKSLVAIEVWYYENAAGIDFYHDGKLVKTVKGGEVPFDHGKLETTASHQLWLQDGGAEYGTSAELDDSGRLHLRTVDGMEHLYDLATGDRHGGQRAPTPQDRVAPK